MCGLTFAIPLQPTKDMAVCIKKQETEGNEVLSAEVIILEAVTLSLFPTHPDTRVLSFSFRLPRVLLQE